MPFASPPAARRGPRGRFVGSLLIAMFCGPGAAAAADGGAGLAARLVGNTLSAVTYVPRTPTRSSFSDLSRVMFQAYLKGDGRAVVRVWDIRRNSYTPPSERRWTVTGTRLCLDLPPPAPGPICAAVHVWGPRIAGLGTRPYAMLDGDLEPGDALLASH